MPFYNSIPANTAESEQHTGISLNHEKMPFILPSNSLPSNAPALPQLEEYGVRSCSFQGGCSSRQEELIDFDYQRPVQLSPAESAFVNDFRRGIYPNVKHKSAEDIIKEANRLWRRLLRCKAYSKYRERKPKDNSSSQDMKWPEHLEVAFCQAIIIYPPVGRRMVASGDSNKARGRNELIADFIQRYTGEPRTRKQVSSHIQVLKPMVKEDQIVTDHLAVPDHKINGRHSRHRRRNSEMSTSSTRYSSQDSIQVPHRGRLPTSYRDVSYNSSISPSRFSTPSPTSIHEPVHFEMFIRDNSRDESSHPLHTFTSFRQSPARMEDIYFANTTELCTQLPQLSSILLPEDLTRSQIIVAESKLRLMSDILPKGAELGIQLEVSSLCDLAVYEDFTCETRFFEDGELASEPILGRIEYNAHYRRMGNIQFGSDFWARKVLDMAQQLRRADELRSKAGDLRSCGLNGGMSELAEPLEDEARDSDEEVRKSIGGMTGLQEISARLRATGENVRLLLICWDFEQVIGEREAGTSWKNVTVGPSQNRLGHQLQLPYFRHEVLRHNNSFGPGSSVEDVSCVLLPHLQQRHSVSPHQLQQTHYKPLGISTGSMDAADLESTLDYSNSSTQLIDFPNGLQMSFDTPLQVSFSSSFNTTAMGSFDASFHNVCSFDTTAGTPDPSPYKHPGPWPTATSFHGAYRTGYFASPAPEDDDIGSQAASFSTQSYGFDQRNASDASKPQPYMDESRRHSITSISGGYSNSLAYSSYTPSPFVPSLGSFAEEVQSRPGVGLSSDKMDSRRHSLAATSFVLGSGGQWTCAPTGYVEGRSVSMGF